MSSSAAGTPSPTPSSSPVAGTPTVGQLKALDTFSPLVEDRLRNSMLPVLSDEGKKKKRRAPGDENDDPADSTPATYRWTGRNLARSVGPYVRIHTIVEHGVAMALADSDDESPAETVEEKRLTESWNIIKDTIPGFAEEMIGLGGNRILRKQVCTEIQEGVRGARGDDSSALKRSAPDYLELPAAPTTEDGSATVPAPPALPAPKIKAGGNKVDRGYENPATARAILPVKHQPTAETFARIRAGDIIVLGTELPYLLYRDGYEYNEDDREDGLLEGHTLFACAKHIYQGPSAALKAPGYNRGKAGNAALNGVTALTRRDIAYVACQSRFALSSQQHWGVADGTFSYLDFFWTIVDILRGEEGQEIID
ncbi:hypothetical protein DFH09DRAFT_1308304 [Mycena vulgaris]|nr:hypothetical protein DFH09DRAFT_1308304 [Mycena vulgaris]